MSKISAVRFTSTPARCLVCWIIFRFTLQTAYTLCTVILSALAGVVKCVLPPLIKWSAVVVWLFLVYHACTLHICFYYLSDSGDCVFGWGSVVCHMCVCHICMQCTCAGCMCSQWTLQQSMCTYALQLNALCCIVRNLSDGTLSFYFRSYEISIMTVILAIIYLYCPSDVAVFHCLLLLALCAYEEVRVVP